MLVRMPQDKQSEALKLRTWAALVVETGGSCAALFVGLRQAQEQQASTSCAGLLDPSLEATLWYKSSGHENLSKLCGRACAC